MMLARRRDSDAGRPRSERWLQQFRRLRVSQEPLLARQLYAGRDSGRDHAWSICSCGTLVERSDKSSAGRSFFVGFDPAPAPRVLLPPVVRDRPLAR